MGDTEATRVLVVVGAGTMGQGIAQVGLLAGFETRLVDLSLDALEAASDAIARRIDRTSGPDTAVAIARLSVSTDLALACRDAYAVIETVIESMPIKVDVLRVACESAPVDALLGSNTSALSIAEMAEGIGTPSRLVGLHFFNPVPKMQLVEVVRGTRTSAEAIAAAQTLARELGKEPVVLADSPGFVASRINALIGNEAFCMLEAGVASAKDIDTALKLGLNHPMGPFELGDLVGWDVRLKVLEYLHANLGEKYRPCSMMIDYVAEGRLGRKVGRGVYDYPA